MPSDLPRITRDQLKKTFGTDRSVREMEKVLSRVQTILDNAADILTLTEDVSQNTSDIADNVTAIAANATAILARALKNGSSSELFSVANATSTYNAVNYSQVIGLGQTWQNLTASRALGTTYTNNTGKPIYISVSVIGTSNVTSIGTVGGIAASNIDISSSKTSTHSFIVPNGVSYSISSTTSTLIAWSELR